MNSTTDNKPISEQIVESLELQMREVMNRAYNLGVTHSQDIVKTHSLHDYSSVEPVLDNIYNTLEKLKK